MNCSLEFYSCIQNFCFAFFCFFFYSHIGVRLTFLQVGHEVSDALCMGKEDYLIAMKHTTDLFLIR